jgi:hypothetical protein
MSYGTDALNNYNLFIIAWLGKSRPYTSLKTNNNFHWPNDAYLEPSLVKVVYIIVIDAVLSFSLFY